MSKMLYSLRQFETSEFSDPKALSKDRSVCGRGSESGHNLALSSFLLAVRCLFATTANFNIKEHVVTRSNCMLW